MLFFALLTYGIAFLLADARIFGCDAKLWNSGAEPEETCKNIGVFKLRQHLLHFSFFSDLLGCYFCVGCYAGPIAYWLLWFGQGSDHSLHFAATLSAAVVMTVVSIPLGGAVAYGIDAIVSKIEI